MCLRRDGRGTAQALRLASSRSRTHHAAAAAAVPLNTHVAHAARTRRCPHRALQSMVLCLALLLVHTEPPGLPRACLAPLLTYAALVAASTVWRRRACAAVSPAADPASAPLPASSYLRWHQLLLVALRFGWAGCEAAIDWLRR